MFKKYPKYSDDINKMDFSIIIFIQITCDRRTSILQEYSIQK